MSEVIKIENLSKIYKRKTIRNGQNLTEDFWALRDLSLSVNQGDVLGVIGKNGAGKSTLLKVLSKITSPTHGKITIHGRIGSLLEVGTGFHPEMTGRENIYMNGNILGMSNAEITKKFDEIIDFSGVADFLETPVKRYSSGMQTRLAFAVAAHLEPEILIVDEVLAVGDAEFQKKCLGKMDEIGNSDRTILFVSHNMNAIKSLCNKCIWLKDGVKIAESNQTIDVIKQYLQETVSTNKKTSWSNTNINANTNTNANANANENTNTNANANANTNDNANANINANANTNANDNTNTNTNTNANINANANDNYDATKNKFIEFLEFKLVDKNGAPTGFNLHSDDDVFVEVEFQCKQINADLQIGYALYDSTKTEIFLSYHNDKHYMSPIKFTKDRSFLKTRLPLEILNDGEYTVQLIAGIKQAETILSQTDSSVTIGFSLAEIFNRSNTWGNRKSSVIAPILEWRYNK